MAAKYRKIDPRIWHDEVFDNFDAVEKLCVLYLLSSNYTNRAGFFVGSRLEFAERVSGGCQDSLSKALGKACVSLSWPLAYPSKSVVVVFMPNYLRYNPATNDKHAAGIISDLHDVPRCELKDLAIKQLMESGDERVSKALRKGIESLSKGYRNQKQEQKQKQKQEQKQESVAAHAARTRFRPPTIDEVRDYVESRGARIDPEQFVDYYAARGWMLNNRQMRDWQAAVRTWEKRQPAMADKAGRVASAEDLKNWTP